MSARARAVTFAAGALAGVGAAMLGPMLPALSAQWGLDDAAAGVLPAVEFAGGFCGGVASRWLAQRSTLSALLTWGLALFAAGLAVCTLNARALTTVSLFVCGLGLGLINPAANLLAARQAATPEAGLSVFAFVWASGALAAPTAIAFTLRTQTLPIVFAELAVVAAIAAAFSLGRHGAAEVAPSTVDAADVGVTPRRLALVTGVLLFLYVGVETSVSTWLPTAAERWLALPPSQAALGQSLFWIALLSGRLLTPAGLRFVRPGTLIGTGIVSAGAAIGWIACSRTSPWLLAGACVAGLGLAPVNPLILASFTAQLGTAAARSIGPILAVAGLGGAVMPWLVGAVSTSAQSLRPAFLVPVIACVLMLTLHFLGRKQRLA